ncbi:MAG: amidohydrolase family protein [Phycisphaerae bacterium]
MILDMHCHYTFTLRAATATPRFSFEPAVNDFGSALDSLIAPRAMKRIAWRILRKMLRIDGRLPPGEALDSELDRAYERHLVSGPIDRYVLLAFDAYHDDAGRRPPIPQRRDELGSDIYTSNSLVRAACAANPSRFLFGASVHPYRRHAVDAVAEVFAGGACLLKWLPLHQNIDIADPRTIAVLECCAKLGLPVLVHYSEEFTLATQHPEYRSATALLDVLARLRRRGRMPITIVAHVATPVTPFGEMRSHQALVDALLNEFADAPLYADISALSAFGKVELMASIAGHQALHRKLLFGSDFPIPPALIRLRGRLGREYARIAALPSWPAQALEISTHVGFNDIVFRRAAELLPNVSRETPRPGV